MISAQDDTAKMLGRLRDLEEPVLRIHDLLAREEREKILNWISSIRYWTRRDELGWMEGTGEWLLRHDIFLRWRDIDETAILWLNGISESCDIERPNHSLTHSLPLAVGSGKSTLASLALETLSKPDGVQRNTSIIFFFCDKNTRSDELKNQNMIYRCLLKQLLRLHSDKSIPSRIFEEHEKKGRDGDLSEDESKRSILSFIKQNPTILILDALDECDIDVRTRIIQDLIFPLLSSESYVKIFVTSRPETDLISVFGDETPLKCARFTMKVQSEEDVNLYIKKELEFYPEAWRGSLEKELIKRSAGM